MNGLIKNNLKLFFKTKYLLFSFLLFIAIINIFLAAEFYNYLIHEDILYYLGESQRLGIVYFVFFVFISYEYCVKNKNDNLLESISVTSNGKFFFYISKLITLVIIILIMTLNIMIYNYAVYFLKEINLWSFVKHIFLNNLLNIFLVSLTGICIGTMAALKLKRFKAYFLIILLTILISPIIEFVPYILFMGFGINIYPLMNILDILPPNLNWVSESLYGLSIEPYRWNLIIFWICLLSSAILLNVSSKKIKLINYISYILVILSIYNFYSYMNSGSIVKKDYNPINFTAFDELYYSNEVQREEKANFTIDSYDMKIKIDRQLKNYVTITLNETDVLKGYKFTLYRNYDIKEILDKDNNPLEFKRHGDYIDVYNPADEKLETIQIEYSGYSPVFYSNLQGVLLPGCFPYYPIEGYRRMYLKEQSSYIPIIRDYTVKFNISVESALDIYSNLKNEGKRYYGEAQAATLMGGFINEKKYEDVTFYGLSLEELPKENNLLRIDEILNQYKSVLFKDQYTNFKDMKIFQSTITLSSKLTDNGIVSFQDHILTYDLSEECLVQGFAQKNIPYDVNKLKVKKEFFDYILHKERFINISKSELENNMIYKFRRLFLEKINELGEDYVIKKTYYYLTDENDTRDSELFIRNLN
ncbi:ABC transporter permease [Sedimentibacter hydroxybenzoicus DSM 7310]|uniref:ABC transporter permease n=1 Tax=Sedimentibacter hydroxybenzoicus DSM 7310 TaxID=1123245 RepID=A0A974BMG2_SEDHY|nr:ABC transporter permease [Sedimentibacter hydroxybenzoicus]NYB75551.1 ABC transporter permease [Sedimentibacter hydroxybenzoicus DSM 7310]